MAEALMTNSEWAAEHSASVARPPIRAGPLRTLVYARLHQ